MKIETDKITEIGSNLKSLFLRWLSTIAMFAFLIALFFIQFAHMKIKEQALETMLTSFSILFICFIFIDRLQYKKGQIKGESSVKYIEIQKKHGKMIDELSDEQLRHLKDFCAKIKEEAENDYKSMLLKRVGLTYEQYLKNNWISMNKKEIRKINENAKKLSANNGQEENHILTNKQLKAIIDANKVNFKLLKESELFSETKTKSNMDYDLGISKTSLEARNMVSNIFQSIILTIIACMFTVEVSESFQVYMLVLYLLQLVLLFFKCYSTYLTGYRNITEKVYNRIVKKIDLLRQFNVWFKDNFEQNEFENKDLILTKQQ